MPLVGAPPVHLLAATFSAPLHLPFAGFGHDLADFHSSGVVPTRYGPPESVSKRNT